MNRYTHISQDIRDQRDLITVTEEAEMIMMASSYEGRSITLRSGLLADGTWFCEYTIIEFRPAGSFIESGYPVGSFTRRDKAEAAALEVAQSVINVRDYVGSPIDEAVLV